MGLSPSWFTSRRPAEGKALLERAEELRDAERDADREFLKALARAQIEATWSAMQALAKGLAASRRF